MKPGMQWPIGIAVILAATVAANLTMMRIANSDPSFAVEPDYYQKAVAFDSTLAHVNASARLGWSARVTIAQDTASRGDSTSVQASDHTMGPLVAVALRDSLQQPITHATVTVHALFIARANDVLSATLAETTPGNYRAALPVQHAGIWEIRIAATRGTDAFVSSARVDVAPGTIATRAAADSLSMFLR